MDREIRPPEYDAKRGSPTEAWLRYAYLEQGLSIRQIAKLTGRKSHTILYLLRRRGIPVRSQAALPEIDIDWLRKRYLEDGAPLREIAKEANLTYNQIQHLLRVHHLPVRRPIQRDYKPDRDWLYQKYVIEGLSSQQICELTGYSRQGLRRLMRQFGLEPKGRSLPALAITYDELYQLHVVDGLTAVKIAARLGCAHTTISRLIKRYRLDPARPLANERMVPPISRDVLWKFYWVDQLSTDGIAQRFNVSKGTVRRWMKILQVPARKWNGPDIYPTYAPGRTSPAPDKRDGREFDATERNAILTRDSWRCRMPGCACTEAWRLEVHHIIPIKHGGDNALTNGITLCTSCHDSILNRELNFVTLFQSLVNEELDR